MVAIQLLPPSTVSCCGGGEQTFVLREPLFAGKDTLVDSLVAGMLPECQAASTAGHPWSLEGGKAPWLRSSPRCTTSALPLGPQAGHELPSESSTVRMAISVPSLKMT